MMHPAATAGATRGAEVFPRVRDWWLLAAALAVLYLVCLGSRGLNDPDEGRYANIALAMAKPGGDWWEPRESGYGHYDKPPLVYWATALSFRAFGFNEWAARVPSLLGAAVSLAALAWAAVRLYDARVAWWAVLICGTSLQFWVLARVLSPDALMTGWCTLAVAAWAECRHRGGAWTWWTVMLVGWSLAWWTKATPSLVPLAGLLAGTWATGDRAGRLALRPGRLLLAILVLGAPWYLSMLRRYPELSQFFFRRELVNRVVGRVDGRHGPLYYYLPLSLAAWLPWWPPAVWKARQARPADWMRAIGIEGWIVLVGFVVFSLVNSKLPTYTLPLAPWVALGLARLWCAGMDARPSLGRVLPGAIFALVVLGTAAFLPDSVESSLGPNSSLRPVCRYLREQGARVVDCDHYWPDVEFYLDDVRVRYVLPANPKQRERPTDPGLHPERFVDPTEWLTRPTGGERWLVRYRRQRDSPFDALPAALAGRKAVTIGEFDLYRLDSAEAPGTESTDTALR